MLILGVCLLVRLLLLWQNSQEWLSRRIEVSTPVNQWMRGMTKIMNLAIEAL